MRTLQQGSRGDDVAALQRRLNELSFDAGAADGIFGGGTRAAVEQFQRSRNLTADGIVGPATAEALGLVAEEAAEVPSSIVEVTPQVVKPMFPATNINNIRQNLPSVMQALVDDSLADQKMVLMALATIRAETASFRPISEGQSKYNTEPGGEPFGKYNNREDLGNLGSPDGANFRGRGFIQLTGRHNYTVHGRNIGLGDQLIENPEFANRPDIAARLLSSFLKAAEPAIRAALEKSDLKQARKLVNGGSHGLDNFTDAYNVGLTTIPEQLTVRPKGAGEAA